MAFFHTQQATTQDAEHEMAKNEKKKLFSSICSSPSNQHHHQELTASSLILSTLEEGEDLSGNGFTMIMDTPPHKQITTQKQN